MKLFIITHHLVADSGFKVTIVKADTEKEARIKYKQTVGFCLGITIQEVTKDVQEVYRYDNSLYEG